MKDSAAPSSARLSTNISIRCFRKGVTGKYKSFPLTFARWKHGKTLREWRFRGNALEIPLAVLKEFGCEISVNLFLASEIPPGTGLGSSASVCVNLTKLLATYHHISLSKYDLAERAFHIARNVLGRPVGKQDEYASAFGGLNFISFYRDGKTHVEPLHLEPDLVRELQSSLLVVFHWRIASLLDNS